ncbi:low molecular weight protein-tyrosine-phosphatase [uncultured Campylobacter sp.]|uniref:low molecular weight protein-tyrosine-phosphatase n=1 Tax=uncultured Campylobacter sp. TaxID=218934 RepID=UPI0026300BFF|nr:low molecular weight protein-tyrosine-phosphatase [uncultured Campylobacter sp.]
MRLLFVCHGNICRSPMAQSVMQNFINQSGLSAHVGLDSAATHTDEIGSPPYYETQRVLKEQKVPLVVHRAVQVTPADYERYDLILCMDDENMRSLGRIFRGKDMAKVKFLLEFAGENFTDCDARNFKGSAKQIGLNLKGAGSNLTHPEHLQIADPYYTRDFERCYADIKRGCEGLLRYIKNSDGIC